MLADLDGEAADEERVVARLMKDPVAWKRLQHTLIESLQHRSEAVARQKAQKRQVKNPLDKKPKTDDRDEAETEPEELDATFVLLAARLSGLSLADISKMSFRGLLGLQEWLKENPPQPTGLGGLLG